MIEWWLPEVDGEGRAAWVLTAAQPPDHRLLNRARWSACQGAGLLLRLLLRAFVPAGLVVLGLDETVERRRGLQVTGELFRRI